MAQWIEISSEDHAAITRAALEHRIHPLAVEDCLHRDQRAKLDDFDGHQLLVWFFYQGGEVHEVQFLIFPDKLIVVPHGKSPDGGLWLEYLKISDYRDVWHLLYQALDRMMDITWQELRVLFDQADEIEESLLQGNVNLVELLQIKRRLSRIDLFLGHLPSVVQQLKNLCQPSGDLKWKFRDLFDHTERVHRGVESYRSQVGSIIELHWVFEANRTNRQVKRLSTLASVALPLTFWASFWGMNFEAIPFERTDFLWGALALMVGSSLFTVWLLVRKGYWRD